MGQLESRGVIRKKSKYVLSKNGIAKVKAREQKLLFHCLWRLKKLLNWTEQREEGKIPLRWLPQVCSWDVLVLFLKTTCTKKRQTFYQKLVKQQRICNCHQLQFSLRKVINGKWVWIPDTFFMLCFCFSLLFSKVKTRILSSLCFFWKNASGFESHKAHFNITSIVMCLQNLFF